MAVYVSCTRVYMHGCTHDTRVYMHGCICVMHTCLYVCLRMSIQMFTHVCCTRVLLLFYMRCCSCDFYNCLHACPNVCLCTCLGTHLCTCVPTCLYACLYAHVCTHVYATGRREQSGDEALDEGYLCIGMCIDMRPFMGYGHALGMVLRPLSVRHGVVSVER